MHAAPPVRMSLAPDPAWRVFVVGCAGVAGANVAAWVALHAHAPIQLAVGAALTAAAGAGLLAWKDVGRRQAEVGTLGWDGAIWQWARGAAAPCAGEVRVMIDLGAWLLLRFSPTLPAQSEDWLAMSRGNAGAQWPAWRAALYARRPGTGPASLPDPS